MQQNNDPVFLNTVPLDAAIIPDRNTIGIACKNKLSNINSDGMLFVLNLRGDMEYTQRFTDELNAKSSLNAIVALPDNKYYFGGSHNTLPQNKRGIIYSADVNGINNEDGVSGIVFYDENRNGQREPNEYTIPNIKIEVDPYEGYGLTDFNGTFFKLATEGQTYTITSLMDTTVFKLTTDSFSYNLDYYPSNPENFRNNFGYFTELNPQASLNLTSDPTRCNTDSKFYLKMVNEGPLLKDASVVLNFDPNVKFISSPITPDEYNENEYLLKWNFDSIFPFQEIYLPINFMMPNEQNTGLVMEFKTSLESEDGSEINEYKFMPTVLCSYDPNDKLVMPIGVQQENFTLFGDSVLTYTVRFQNTGNASAIDVVILDTIDQNFDMSTFKIVNSSHRMQTNINGNFVEFEFKNIHLADSTSNEPESHGQVTYEIKLLEDIENNSLVENRASIYFDYNPPIVTNTTKNVMVDRLVSSENIIDDPIFFVLHPNPTRDKLFIYNPKKFPVDEIKIFDSSGRLVMTPSSENINTTRLSSGYYLLQIRSGGELAMLKFIKL